MAGQSVFRASQQAAQYNAPGGAITVNQYGSGGSAPAVRRPWLAPPLATGMVARPEVTGRLLALVCSESVDPVTIVGVYGTGGFGKTTVAAWACHQPEVRQRFPGGLLFVTLGERVAGGELAAKVNDLVEQLTGARPALTDPLQAGMRLGEALDAHPDPVLLVIDDAWTEQQLEPFTCGGSRCQRLLTTRQRRLVDPGRAVQLDQMTSSQAAALLMRDVAGGDDRLIDRVLAATGRWPVLVALANRALRRTVDYGATVEQALEGIADRLGEDGPSTFDLDNVHQRGRAVAATVRAGLDLLPPETVDRFFELAIFAEDADVPLATLHLLWEATAGLTPRRVRAACEALADLALVMEYRHDTATVRLHDVIRSFLIHEAGPRRLAHLHATLLDAAARILPVRATPPAWWELPETFDYLTRHLVEHLAAADRHDDLAATVTDPRWIATRLTRYGPAEAEADLAAASTRTARLLGRKIRQNAHLLTPMTPRHALVAVLASRLDATEAFPTALLRERSAGAAGSRVVNRWSLPDLPHPALTRTFTGHTDRVTAVAVAPDGSWIATGGDTTVRVWDPDTGACRHTLTGHTSDITALVSAPDGRWLASASADHTVRLWDPTTGACRHTLAGHAGPVTAVATPATGEWVASAGHDWTVRLWDPVTGACRMVLAGHAGRLTTLAADPTGGWIASGGQDHTVRVWDTTTGECRLVHDGHTNWIATLAVAPDTGWLASAGGDSTVRIWNPYTGAVVHTVHGHIGIVCASTTGPTGAWLATTSHDNTIRVWDVGTGTCRHVLTGHTGWVVAAAALAGPAPRLATAGHDRTVRIWNLLDGRCEATYTGHTDRINGLAAAPDGRWLVTVADDRTTRTWDPSTPAPDITAADHRGRISALACHPAGDWVASASDDHTVRLWDPTTGAARDVLHGHTNPVRALAVAPDGTWVATASISTIRVWDPVTGACRHVLRGHAGGVHAIAIAGDGTWLATAGADATVWIWDPTTGTRRHILYGSRSPVTRLAIGPTGEWIAASGTDGSTHIWDPSTGHHRGYLASSANWIGGTVATPNGTRLATTSSDFTIRIWDPMTGTCHRVLGQHPGWITELAVAPDGTWVAAAVAMGRIRVWDIGTGECRHVLTGHPPTVVGLAVAPDGTWLAAATHDGTLTVWRPDSPNPVAAMRVDATLTTCLALPDSRGISLGSTNGALYTFDVA